MLCKLLQKDFIPIGSLFKRTFLKQNNILFHEELVALEDIPFISEICSKAQHTAYSEKESYVYRLGVENSVTNTKPTYKKIISLTGIARYTHDIAANLDSESSTFLTGCSVDYSVTSIVQACKWLTYSESKEVVQRVRSIYSKLPNLGRSFKHTVVIKLFNLSPRLTHNLFYCVTHLFRR
jgi:hypothetical protein